MQYSRGCPFTCEFCDIIELYGRVPRSKATPQILAELETLYALGYRGHVDFVDDNLIGNKKALKLFLPELKNWQEERNYPFEFSTEASVNLADDDGLLQMMRSANFFGVFVGIESPDPETLVAMKKKQNTRRDLVASIHKIYAAGMFVTAGFILGFDSEKASVSDAVVEFIEDSAIPMCMVGLLYALPNTQLTRRLANEGRLHLGHDVAAVTGGDQCTTGLNFETLRPLRDVLEDYKRVLEQIYEPTAYAGGWSASRHFSIERAPGATCQRGTSEAGPASWNWCIAWSQRFLRRGSPSGACSRLAPATIYRPSGLLSRSWCFIFISGRSRD